VRRARRTEPEYRPTSRIRTGKPRTAIRRLQEPFGKTHAAEKPINIVAANSCFAAKKDVYAKSGNYLTRSLCGLTTVGNNTSINRINTLLKPFHHWTAKAIDEGREVLETIAADVWSIRLLEPA